MTTVNLPAMTPSASGGSSQSPIDRRGSWIPTWHMITTRIMELRKRRGLMIALILVNIGIPTIFVVIRLLMHAFDPKSYGPAGGYDIFTNLVAGVMYVFGFIVAATLGCTAGSVDLTDGMFRHLVVTGRSRLALYLARIPAGLAIIVPMVAAGFVVVCAVCVFAAPKTLNYDGAHVPAQLSEPAFESWASSHLNQSLCEFNFGPKVNVNVPCMYSPKTGPVLMRNRPGPNGIILTTAQLKADAVQIALSNYSGYRGLFLTPPAGLMVRAGLWIELEAVIGFIVGLGLASLIGQRTVAVIIMIILEVILTPILSRATIPHLITLQRGVVGLATAHLEPNGLPLAFSGGGPGNGNPASLLVPETRLVAVLVIIGWLVVWTALGAWRMMTRDA